MPSRGPFDVQVKQTRHTEHNILPWVLTHESTNVDEPAKTYIHQLDADTGYRLNDLLRAMIDWDEW